MRRPRHRCVTTFAVFVVAGCGHQSQGIEEPVIPPIALSACRVPDVAEQLHCGTLRVPEDRKRPRGRQLTLPIVVVPAKRADRGVPLFVLLGGPGMGATAVAPLWASELGALREIGDVVLVDQRGTGSGPSSLACPELDDVPAAVSPSVDAVQACRRRLETRADLHFYGTLDAARDLDAAREALGYDRINIDATSYGTRLAQVYLRLYPARVNAMVWFGTLAMDVHLPAGFAEHAQRVVDAIVDECASDASCSAAFPELPQQLARLVSSPPPGVDRTAFSEWVRHRIYSAAGARGLPQLITRAAAGDVSSFTNASAGPAGFREAVLLSVSCSEDEPAIDHRAALARARATWFGSGRLEQQSQACAQWARVAIAPDYYRAVESAVPVLAIAGTHDPVTPIEYARRATQRMTRAQVVVVPHMGHEMDGLANSECLLALEAAFLRNPTRPVDTACVAAIAPPPFAIAD